MALRQPRKGKIALRPNDTVVFCALDRHNVLPSNYLKLLFPDRNTNAFTDRLTALFHGSEVNGYFLDKPNGQWKSVYSDIQHLVYGNAPNAQTLIDDSKLWIPPPRIDNHFVHSLMNGCVGFSFEHLLPSLNLGYIHRHEILEKKQSKLALPVSSGRLVPDDLFGIVYAVNLIQFFAVEIDRATETINTISHKLLGYFEAMTAAPGVPFLYRKEWGIDTFMVMIVTTTETRKRQILEGIRQMNSRHAKRVIVKVLPDFDVLMWRVPEYILTELLEPWDRADGSTFDITVP
jgi:hypothetical protein